MHNSRRIHRIATSLSHGGIVGGAIVYHEQTHRTDCLSAECRSATNSITNDKDNKEIIIVNNNNKNNDDTTATAPSSSTELYAYDELSLYEIFSDRAPSDKEIEAATDTLLENDENII